MDGPMESEEIRSFLSNIEINKPRNTFIFREGANNTSGIKLIGGFDQDLLQLTQAQMYRSLRALKYPHYNFDVLHQVEIFHFNICRLSMAQVGDPIQDTADEVLSPGHYGWFKGLGRPKNSLEGGPAPLLDMYTLLEGVIQHEKDIYTPFAEGEVLAEARVPPCDGDFIAKCVFTGLSERALPFWIIPPCLGYRLPNVPRPIEDYDPEQCMMDDNKLHMNEELAVSFYKNEFGVDIEDNFRIIRFKRSPTTDKLPLRLAEIKGVPAPAQSDLHNPDVYPPVSTLHFLRRHYLWCWKAHVIGGDVSERWSNHTVANELEKLGDDVPLSSGKWDTFVGQEALRHRAFLKRLEMGQESEEEELEEA